MKVWNKIMDFFFEDVEVKEEKKQEELPEADFINKPEQPVPVKTEKPENRSEVREVKPEQPEKPKEKPAFLNVGGKAEKPAHTEVISPVMAKSADTAMSRPKPADNTVSVNRVISPIFGNQDFSSGRYSAGSVSFDEEVHNQSVIGTVFSPINGRQSEKEVAYDEVEDRIASMTTTDFIEKVSEEKPELNNSVELPQLKNRVFEETPIATPGGNTDEDENTDTYENLKLF